MFDAGEVNDPQLCGEGEDLQGKLSIDEERALDRSNPQLRLRFRFGDTNEVVDVDLDNIDRFRMILGEKNMELLGSIKHNLRYA
jgi:hypothetical protein